MLINLIVSCLLLGGDFQDIVDGYVLCSRRYDYFCSAYTPSTNITKEDLKTKETVTVPDRYLNSKNFLKGVFSTHYVVRNDKSTRLRSLSRPLLEGIQLMLIKHGIMSKIEENTSPRIKSWKFQLVITKDNHIKLNRDIGYIDYLKEGSVDVRPTT